MAITEPTEILSEAFREIGREYGYDSVTAEFTEFKEFKVKWRRSCGWAEFDVSDYLMDAPMEVMKGLADVIFSRITRKTKREYPKEMLDWITSDDFVQKKQKVYIARARNIKRKAQGEHVNLNDSYKRLVKMGLVNEDKDVRFVWTKEPTARRIGYCSVLMKVVTISSIFDSPSIPSFVLDYVMYHELIHMSKGFDPFGQRHDTDFHALERLYPQRDDAEEYLKTLHLNF
jgi:hypothetical protein